MMRYYQPALYFVLAMIIFIGCAPQQLDNTAEARAAIAAENDKWMAAFEKGDAAGVAANYTEDTKAMPPNGAIVQGRQGVQDWFQSLIDAGITVKLEIAEVEGRGDMAYEVGKASVLGPDGQQIDDSKYIVIWKKVGTEWKMHRDIWNSNMPLPGAE